jgi:hypothetical protein
MSKKTFKVYLRNGTNLIIYADDFEVKYENGRFTEWHAEGADKWVVFMPEDLLAVERIK